MKKIKKFLNDRNICLLDGGDDITFSYKGQKICISQYCYNNGNSIKGIMITNIKCNDSEKVWGTSTFSSQKSVIRYMEYCFNKGECK